MKLLILGGTRFLGRALVEAALSAGHQVTLFNRGRTNPDLFSQLERLKEDRDGGLEALRGRTWDAVIDTCGYVPRLVHDSAALLANAVDLYTFISSIAVYADLGMPGMDEEAPLAQMEDETVEKVTGETYGPLKVLCETVATEAMNGRALHIRAGLIVGPHDPTDRFTYWPARVARGGEVLAPGSPDAPVQFIDVRDLARWVVQATEAWLTGPFNATGPVAPLTMGQLLACCRQVSNSDAAFTWVSETFLTAQGVAPFTEAPLWVPRESSGIMSINCEKALQTGLAIRPLAETVRDTLAWQATRPAEWEWRNGLSAEREAKLLRAWHARA
ncbi:MAG: SDR family oxidoreductase [Anaerolineae bacterium]